MDKIEDILAGDAAAGRGLTYDQLKAKDAPRVVPPASGASDGLKEDAGAGSSSVPPDHPGYNVASSDTPPKTLDATGGDIPNPFAAKPDAPASEAPALAALPDDGVDTLSPALPESEFPMPVTTGSAPAADYTPQQLEAFRKGTASKFDPNSWLDRNKMQRMVAGDSDWSDSTKARDLGKDWKGPEQLLAAPTIQKDTLRDVQSPLAESGPAPTIQDSPPAPTMAAQPTPDAMAGLPDVPLDTSYDLPSLAPVRTPGTLGALEGGLGQGRDPMMASTPNPGGWLEQSPPGDFVAQNWYDDGVFPSPTPAVPDVRDSLSRTAPPTPDYAGSPSVFDPSEISQNAGNPVFPQTGTTLPSSTPEAVGISPNPAEMAGRQQGLAATLDGAPIPGNVNPIGWASVPDATDSMSAMSPPVVDTPGGGQPMAQSGATLPPTGGSIKSPFTPAATAQSKPGAPKPSNALGAAAKTLAKTSHYTNPLLQDWRAAAQSRGYRTQKVAGAKTPDAESLERAFMDQAYAELRARSKALLRDQHRIGFEVIYSNEDSSRMVGLFGFRAGSRLFFVPAFFLQAVIKGVDLLYRAQDRMFVPNTEEWVAHLLEQAHHSTGSPVDRNVGRRHAPMNMNMHMLATPPYGRGGVKAAAADLVLDDNPQWSRDDVVDMFKAAHEARNIAPGLLRDFLTELGPDAVAKVASWTLESDAFAEAITQTIPSSHWQLELPRRQKAASTPSLRMLVQPKPGVVRPDKWLKYAFDIIDEREPDTLSSVYETPMTENMEEIGSPGVWDVLMADGSKEQAIVANSYTGDVGREAGSCGDYPPAGPPVSALRTEKVIVLLGNRNSQSCCDTIFGDNMQPLTDHAALKDTVQTGKAYRAVNLQSGEMTRPFFVHEVENGNGVKICKISRYGDATCNTQTLVINPDFAGLDFASGDLGADARFVEVAFTRRAGPHDNSVDYAGFLPLGNTHTLDQWILSNAPVKKASVVYQADRDSFRVRVDEQEVSNLSAKAAMLNLVRGCRIPADNAFWLLGTAEAAGRSDVYLMPSKQASMRLLRDPFAELDAVQQNSTDFGIPLEVPQLQTSDQEWTGDTPPAHRIGDGWDPTIGSGMSNDPLEDDVLLSRSPDEIAQLAQQRQMPHVFEHGVIGELVNTFDANALVASYIPKIEEGVDSVGRMLFLIYWKPGDFEFAYGRDDMKQLENSALSNFKSNGAMLLDLKRKSGGSLPNMGATSLM